jgi:HEAT repeat protein
MPKETIRRLAEDAHRVMVAGAHLAAGDPDLAKDKEKLEKLDAQLGQKTPVFRQLAEGIVRVQAKSGAALVGELLTLSTQVAQVRAAQTSLAPVEGAVAPAEPCPPIGTPCNARELYDLQTALVQSGSGRMEKIDGAVERGDIADLRLFDAVVQALGDVYIGETVASKACPLFGAAISPALRARFNPRGGSPDARRLEALVAVEKAGAQDVVLQAFREGKPPVRAAALDAIADYLPGRAELEQPVLDVVAREKTQAVRRAAVRALAGYSSEASLEALLGTLDVDYARHAAAEALGRSTHPRAVARLMELLDEALAPPKKSKPAKDEATAAKSKGKAGAAKKPAAAPSAKEARVEREARITLLLGALRPHKEPAIAARAIELLDEFGLPAARAVLESGSPAQLARVADLLEGKDESLYEPAVIAAGRLGADEAFQRLSRGFRAGDTTKQGLKRADAILGSLEPGGDPRWSKLLIPLLKSDSGPLVAKAATALGKLGDKEAVPVLIAALGSKHPPGTKSAMIEALGQLGDGRAIDPILEALGASVDYYLRWSAQRAILAIADPASVEKVRTVTVKAQAAPSKTGSGWGGKVWMLTHLLAELERRFPGR